MNELKLSPEASQVVWFLLWCAVVFLLITKVAPKVYAQGIATGRDWMAQLGAVGFMGPFAL